MQADDAKTLEFIKAVVLLLDEGMQPPRDMDVLPAIDGEYAEVRHWPDDESGYPGLQLTAKGVAAAALWRLNVRRRPP